LSFSIGTFVGKKYSDNQYKLSALEPKKANKEERSVASVEDKDKKHDTLSDDEIKKLAEEFVADDSEDSTASHDSHEAPTANKEHAAAEAHAAPAAKPHEAPAQAVHAAPKAAATTANASHNEAPTAAAHQIIDGHAPEAPAKAQPRHPTSLPKDVAQYSVGKYTVQVASFATEQEARQRANELKEKGYSAFFVPAQVKGKSWYRVSVGLFANENEAKEYKKEFMAKSKIESAIIQKITN